MDITFTVSLITGVTSVVLAIFAIWLARSAERESRANFEKTRDLLAEIDKSASVIEKNVTESQQHLLSTVTNLLNQTAVPPKPDLGEQIGVEVFRSLLSDPDKASQTLSALENLSKLSEQQNERRDSQQRP